MACACRRRSIRPGHVLTLGNTRLRVAIDAKVDAEIVGESAAMQQMRREIARLAAVPMPVLILGETGTGKELVARALHDQSGRRGEFVAVNCGSLPKELIESELFGHERGAFTGADARRIGLFQAADGGTLFLDEIGELPEALQTRLLRVLESGVVRPVGATKETTVNVRVVAATHVDLERAARMGEFRMRSLLSPGGGEDRYAAAAHAAVGHSAARRPRPAGGGGARASLPAVGGCDGRAHGASLAGQRARAEERAQRAAALGNAILEPEDLALGELVARRRRRVRGHRRADAARSIEKEILQRAVRRSDGNQRAASVELASRARR